MWGIWAMEWSSAVKGNGMLTPAMTRMNCEDLILSESSES